MAIQIVFAAPAAYSSYLAAAAAAGPVMAALGAAFALSKAWFRPVHATSGAWEAGAPAPQGLLPPPKPKSPSMITLTMLNRPALATVKTSTKVRSYLKAHPGSSELWVVSRIRLAVGKGDDTRHPEIGALASNPQEAMDALRMLSGQDDIAEIEFDWPTEVEDLETLCQVLEHATGDPYRYRHIMLNEPIPAHVMRILTDKM